MEQKDILELLHQVKHPETGLDLVSQGMVENLIVTEEKIQFTLSFPRSRDPFATSLKKACDSILSKKFPQYAGHISIFIKEAPPKKIETKKPKQESGLGKISHIIAISSAKGGVGKSTITANLAVALHQKGYKVGVLDADIYGPSIPTMFRVEDYQPIGDENDGDNQRISPALNMGVKIMSIGFFIKPGDPLIWRGPMATNALRQLTHQTDWGELDFLLIDMPPGTGDIHITLMQDLNISGAIIVSTPQKIALEDVRRGIEMFRSKNINIPILGIVENMAWFTPAELPENRYYIFGKWGTRELAQKEDIPLLAEIPLIQSVREASDAGTPIVTKELSSAAFYTGLADNFVLEFEKLAHSR